MKHYFLTLLFLLVAGVASAQEFSLSGKVLDAADTDVPIAMATVRLMKNDTLQVAACATESDGTFLLKVKRLTKLKKLVLISLVQKKWFKKSKLKTGLITTLLSPPPI